jgi:hypothetical protein
LLRYPILTIGYIEYYVYDMFNYFYSFFSGELYCYDHKDSSWYQYVSM